MKHTTETGRTLVPESHYVAMINNVKEKTVKEFILYDWSFESVVDGKSFYFGLSMFSSQMADILRAENIPFVVVANKIDRLNQTEKAHSLKAIESSLGAEALAYSARIHKGREELLATIAKVIQY